MVLDLSLPRFLRSALQPRRPSLSRSSLHNSASPLDRGVRRLQVWGLADLRSRRLKSVSARRRLVKIINERSVITVGAEETCGAAESGAVKAHLRRPQGLRPRTAPTREDLNSNNIYFKGKKLHIIYRKITQFRLF